MMIAHRIAHPLIACLLILIITISLCNSAISGPDVEVVVGGEGSDIQGFTVLRVIPRTEHQLDFLRTLRESLDRSAFSDHQDVDFWSEPSQVNTSVDMMLSPRVFHTLRDELTTLGLGQQTLIADVGARVSRERHTMTRNALFYGDWKAWSRAGDSSQFFADWRNFQDYQDLLDTLAIAHPDLAEVSSIGRSTEGRPLKGITIGRQSLSNKLTNRGPPKKLIWLEGGIHAREWISPMTAAYVAHQLLTRANSDPAISLLLDQFDFHILPISNPDGFAYTHTQPARNRLWRKTRSGPRGFWSCRGTDPNRNWDFHWREAGSSGRPCADTYAGPRAFSEPETKAMSDYIMAHRARMAMYLSFHSYSQLLLTPWGYTTTLPRDYAELKRVADLGAGALKAVHGTRFKVGSPARILYAAAGGSDDWAKGVAKVKYSYTFELRDLGSYGFVLPAHLIRPVGEETLAAVLKMCAEVAIAFGL